MGSIKTNMHTLTHRYTHAHIQVHGHEHITHSYIIIHSTIMSTPNLCFLKVQHILTCTKITTIHCHSENSTNRAPKPTDIHIYTLYPHAYMLKTADHTSTHITQVYTYTHVQMTYTCTKTHAHMHLHNYHISSFR